MAIATELYHGQLSAYRYICDSGPDDAPFAEVHPQYSLSIVLSGSFSCRCRGRAFDFVPGSVMIGHPGDEYVCSHEHHARGDECLSFAFSDDLANEVGPVWRAGGLAPLPQMMLLGELAQRTARDDSELGLDEVGLLFAARIGELVTDRVRSTSVSVLDRRRTLNAVHRIEHSFADDIDLASLAEDSGLSAFHFLRLFSAVIGVTPHQYLIRMRLRAAARLLADDERPVTDIALDAGFSDLSNFIRTFHRAAGLSPRRFRQLANGDRKIVQERLAALN
ncbi:MAG: AraC family transcriptional regulator [Hyphomicrobiales bacterium]|nr:MAG: AraC family transcriptional regulator [Hyphomicrobiales bacterium]